MPRTFLALRWRWRTADDWETIETFLRARRRRLRFAPALRTSPGWATRVRVVELELEAAEN